jgi:two-component system response regulator FlrC
MADQATPAREARALAREERVLVVDDEPSVRRFAARVLKEEGYHVHEAQDGAEALALLESGASLIDCVVSDVMMPRLNGVELLQALSLRHPGLPVLLMSAYGTAELVERGIAAPCGILAKPFDPDTLVDVVRKCLAARS